ncbi:hypothetical protein ACROYT_G001725 [Oculina patagonica]
MYRGLIFVFNIVAFYTICRGQPHLDSEHRLMKHLFANYSKEVRPVIDKEQPIPVNFDMMFSQLVELNGRSQIMTSKVWIRQSWENPFLRWKPADYGGVRFINIDPKLVWKPDIVLYNSIQSDSGEMYKFNTKVVINYNGSCQWYAPTEVKTVCKIDITYFPFDTQRCTMVFGSWTYTSASLNLMLAREEVDLSGYILSGEWDLVKAEAVRNVVEYSCCPDPFIDITYSLFLRRRVLFYLNNLIFPCVALAILTVFAFFLPPEAGERISLIITILLGLTVYTLIFTENIPPTSEVTPLLTKYSTAIMVLLGCSLVVSCLVLWVYHHDTSVKMSTTFEFIVFKVLSKILGPKPALEKTPKDPPKRKYTPVSVVADRWPTYFPVQRRTISESGNSSPTSRSPNGTPQEFVFPAQMERKMDQVIAKLDAVANSLTVDQSEEDKKKKWQAAAQIIDKFFFWVFTIVVITVTVVMYFMIPS